MFKQGESGNIKGRPQGTPNKVNQEIRSRINDFLDNNFETIQNDLMQLEASQRVKFYIELIQYGLPKLKQVELNSDIFIPKITGITFDPSPEKEKT